MAQLILLLIIYIYIEKQLNYKIVNTKKIEFKSLTHQEKENIIRKYIEVLYALFGERNVVLFKPKLANQYIERRNPYDIIKHTKVYKKVGNLNKFFDDVYDIVKGFTGFIHPPKHIIGDSALVSPFEFHFCKPYYDFMAAAIQSFTKTGIYNFDKELADCEGAIYQLYNYVFCCQILFKLGSRIEKKLVLVAKTRQFEAVLQDKYKKDIFVYIEYNEYSDMNNIEDQISDLCKQHNDLVFLIPECFRHSQNGLHTIFYKNKKLYAHDYILPFYTRINIGKYKGLYEDIYNNKFMINSSINITYEGAGNFIEIGEKVSPFSILIVQGAHCCIGNNLVCKVNFTIGAWHESRLSIKNNVTIGQLELSLTPFSCVSIGEDVLMSLKEMIYSGDGHAIFQKNSNGKYEHINRCVNDSITIGDHVWIGYGCKILSGAEIGSGSMVGAGSIVNKKFPNNVMLVGSPARIIKKNIAWCSNVLVAELEQDQNVFNNYANDTIDE